MRASQAIGVESTTTAVAGLYEDFLDGWLVAPEDEAAVAAGPGWRSAAGPC